MKKIKKTQKTNAALHVVLEALAALLLVFFGGLIVNVLMRDAIAERDAHLTEAYQKLKDVTEELEEMKRPSGELRESVLKKLSLTDHISKGDEVHIRTVCPDGEDSLLISKRKVVSAERDSLVLLMSEEEIRTWSDAETGLLNKELLRIYAVRYP